MRDSVEGDAREQSCRAGGKCKDPVAVGKHGTLTSRPSNDASGGGGSGVPASDEDDLQARLDLPQG